MELKLSKFAHVHMIELRSLDPLDLNLLSSSLFTLFFFFQLLYPWKQGWWPFNGVTSGIRDSVPHRRGGGECTDVWAVKDVSYFFPSADCPRSRPFLTLHCCRWTWFPAPLPYFCQTAPSPTLRFSCLNGQWRHFLRGQPSSTFLECLETFIAWASYAW